MCVYVSCYVCVLCLAIEKTMVKKKSYVHRNERKKIKEDIIVITLVRRRQRTWQIASDWWWSETEGGEEETDRRKSFHPSGKKRFHILRPYSVQYSYEGSIFLVKKTPQLVKHACQQKMRRKDKDDKWSNRRELMSWSSTSQKMRKQINSKSANRANKCED